MRSFLTNQTKINAIILQKIIICLLLSQCKINFPQPILSAECSNENIICIPELNDEKQEELCPIEDGFIVIYNIKPYNKDINIIKTIRSKNKTDMISLKSIILGSNYLQNEYKLLLESIKYHNHEALSILIEKNIYSKLNLEEKEQIIRYTLEIPNNSNKIKMIRLLIDKTSNNELKLLFNKNSLNKINKYYDRVYYNLLEEFIFTYDIDIIKVLQEYIKRNIIDINKKGTSSKTILMHLEDILKRDFIANRKYDDNNKKIYQFLKACKKIADRNTKKDTTFKRNLIKFNFSNHLNKNINFWETKINKISKFVSNKKINKDEYDTSEDDQ